MTSAAVSGKTLVSGLVTTRRRFQQRAITKRGDARSLRASWWRCFEAVFLVLAQSFAGVLCCAYMQLGAVSALLSAGD